MFSVRWLWESWEYSTSEITNNTCLVSAIRSKICSEKHRIMRVLGSVSQEDRVKGKKPGEQRSKQFWKLQQKHATRKRNGEAASANNKKGQSLGTYTITDFQAPITIAVPYLINIPQLVNYTDWASPMCNVPTYIYTCFRRQHWKWDMWHDRQDP